MLVAWPRGCTDGRFKTSGCKNLTRDCTCWYFCWYSTDDAQPNKALMRDCRGSSIPVGGTTSSNRDVSPHLNIPPHPLMQRRMSIPGVLLPAEVSDRSNQACATSRLVPIVGNRNAVDDVTRIAFGNLAFVMPLDGTTACVADAGDRYSVDREICGAHTVDLATMRCCVT